METDVGYIYLSAIFTCSGDRTNVSRVDREMVHTNPVPGYSEMIVAAPGHVLKLKAQFRVGGYKTIRPENPKANSMTTCNSATGNVFCRGENIRYLC